MKIWTLIHAGNLSNRIRDALILEKGELLHVRDGNLLYVGSMERVEFLRSTSQSIHKALVGHPSEEPFDTFHILYTFEDARFIQPVRHLFKVVCPSNGCFMIGDNLICPSLVFGHRKFLEKLFELIGELE